METKEDNRIAGGKPVPRGLSFFKSLTPCGGRGGKALYKDDKGFYYQWDSLHGEWEKFNKTGHHLGALPPNGGDPIKDAVKGRKITIS